MCVAGRDGRRSVTVSHLSHAHLCLAWVGEAGNGNGNGERGSCRCLISRLTARLVQLCTAGLCAAAAAAQTAACRHIGARRTCLSLLRCCAATYTCTAMYCGFARAGPVVCPCGREREREPVNVTGPADRHTPLIDTGKSASSGGGAGRGEGVPCGVAKRAAETARNALALQPLPLGRRSAVKGSKA